VPLLPDVIVIQSGLLLDVLHEQLLPEVTLTLPATPVAAALALPGDIE
jgi:hypothetical protein